MADGIIFDLKRHSICHLPYAIVSSEDGDTVWTVTYHILYKYKILMTTVQQRVENSSPAKNKLEFTCLCKTKNMKRVRSTVLYSCVSHAQRITTIHLKECEHHMASRSI